MDNGWRCCEEKRIGGEGSKVTTVYKGLQRSSQVYKGGEEKEIKR